MCTAISLSMTDHYFGRNLDLEYTYAEKIVITPRRFPIPLRNGQIITTHHAIIGIATVIDGYPLYYDCANELGLCVAGLNFPGNATYQPYDVNKLNITPFELPLWLLSRFSSVDAALEELPSINLLNEAFSDDISLTPLHWLLADNKDCVVLEPYGNGLKIHRNPLGVLTNNPQFPYHMENLANYLGLSPALSRGVFAERSGISPHGNGTGGIGLPGDYSSPSRFVRAAFVKVNSAEEENEEGNISQFFHILNAVAMPKGSIVTEHGLEQTMYSSCCNASKGIYYYTTYSNSQISAISLNHEDLNNDKLICYPLITNQQIRYEN